MSARKRRVKAWEKYIRESLRLGECVTKPWSATTGSALFDRCDSCETHEHGGAFWGKTEEGTHWIVRLVKP